MQHNPRGAGAVIALDLGGTKIAGAVMDPQAGILASGELPTPATQGAEAVLDAMAKLVADLRSRAECGIDGLGLGAAGVIDPATARVLSATDTISGWAGTDLAGQMFQRTGLETRAVNDVHAHGLGEARFGAGLGAREVLLLAVGTGIGGSHLIDGQAHTGAHRVAGHMGHIDSPLAAGIQCSCGRTGHLEAIAAGPAIHRHYLRLGGNPEAVDTRAVAQLAESGDELAVTALRTGALAAGMAAGSLANILDPELVIISGGMAHAGEAWWQWLREGYESSAIDSLQGTQLVPAQLGTTAAFYGAASLFWTPERTTS
ncbi:ROK family protein [Glutamicibacter protophormiae]|uniref:Glucokinase n=1 Tax=Glutamicibacter protophormiae TaxID=37930 RepID=A0ABS4XN08_GLUPR|nr:ROK family protein [Glutamicibacter protophormiae]MBP2397760.1 glucokinase [Glutamicibacter protophormiae]GGL86765.1 transcriptional regulator [Glutamicibacter protophormiae]